MDGSIRYLKNREIDKRLWDQCITNSTNGLIYAHSYYLDIMCSNWDALVLNDYEAVMPLPWRKKWGINYIYQPAFVAQLGVFGKLITADVVVLFLKAIPTKFKYIDCPLNHQNLFSINLSGIFRRHNNILDLSHPYQILNNNYRETIRRNIKKAKSYGCTLVRDFPVDDVLGLALQQSVQSGIEQDGFRRFGNLYSELSKKKRARTYGVLSSAGQLIASCVFSFSHNRAYYILVGNHPDGRSLGASHLLIDSFIQDYAQSNLLLDFEGSDARNLAFFYSSFGAVAEDYAAIKLNRLPLLIRWLKD